MKKMLKGSASMKAAGAKALDYALPVAVVGLLGSQAAIAGTDDTFNTALDLFTGFLEGSGGKIMTVMSLALGVAGLASGRFSMGQIAIPVAVGVGAGTGVPIVTSTIGATV